MVATQPVNRIGAHFDSPPVPKRVLPKTEHERGKLWSDIVFDAVLALHNQLNSRSEAVVAAAANSIMELERTRLRHSNNLAGSTHKSDRQQDLDEDLHQTLEPLPSTRRKPPAETKPKPPKPTLPPPPANPLDDATLLRMHAEEIFDELVASDKKWPEHSRRPMTMDRAREYVEAICEEYHVELSQIPPGEFRRISRTFIEGDAANN